MATPHVAGPRRLFKERHPDVDGRADQVRTHIDGRPGTHGQRRRAALDPRGRRCLDLPRADNPLLFTTPTSLSFGSLTAKSTRPAALTLTDAGGGAGDWTTSVDLQTGSGQVTVPPTVTVPGLATVTATAGVTPGDVTGFVVLTRGADVRRIPFWFVVAGPTLAGPRTPLTKPGVVS